MCTYPKQQNLPNCGAYALAYLKWHITNINSVDDFIGEEPTLVMNIYEQIKVKTEDTGLSEGYSNPASMVKYLKTQGYSNVTLYITNAFAPLKASLLLDAGMTEGDTNERTCVNILVNQTIPFTDGQYFIGIFQMERAFHYILYLKIDDKMYCINSHNGELKEAVLKINSPSYDKSTGGNFTGAGILINNRR